MEIDDLRGFVAVVKHGGFRAAADALIVPQPSLTRRILRLEANLGVTLLERGPRGTRLTDRGQTFYRGAQRILATIGEVQAMTTGHWTDTVHLGCTATVAGSFLARFLATWIPAHPEVQVVMIEDATRNLPRRLENRECDLAIISDPIPVTCESYLVQRVSVQALLPVGHRLGSAEAPLDVRQLHGERLLLNGGSFTNTELLHSACLMAGVKPRIVYECTVGQTLAALAEAGMGIAIMGDSIDLRGYDLQRRYIHDHKGERLRFNLHIAWLRDRQLPPGARALADELADSALMANQGLGAHTVQAGLTGSAMTHSLGGLLTGRGGRC